jgi:hypothetical protein
VVIAEALWAKTEFHRARFAKPTESNTQQKANPIRNPKDHAGKKDIEEPSNGEARAHCRKCDGQ